MASKVEDSRSLKGAHVPGEQVDGKHVQHKEFDNVLRQHLLLGELKLATMNSVPGVYVRPSSWNPDAPPTWDGVVFVRGGVYSGGAFKFRMLLDTCMGTSADTLKTSERQEAVPPPRVFFQPPIFHPRVDETTGELSLLPYYATWRRGRDRLWHVLRLIRHIFNTIHTDENDLNRGAGALWKIDKDAFAKTAQSCVRTAEYRALRASANAIHFREWSADYSPVLSLMRSWPVTSTRAVDTSRRVDGAADAEERQQQRVHSAAMQAANVTIRTEGKERSLRRYIEATLGPAVMTTDVNVTAHTCSGYVARMAPDGQEQQRVYLHLDEENGTISLFETDKMRTAILSVPMAEVYQCFQPEDADAASLNAFVLVTPSQVLRFYAPSKPAAHAWTMAVLHAAV